MLKIGVQIIRLDHKMKLIVAVLFCPILIFAQLNLDNTISNRLEPGSVLPEKILDGRSVVFYDPGLSPTEIQSTHESLVKTGIDALAYFEADNPLAGYDTEIAFLKYFITREISCFVVVEKKEHVYRIWVTDFKGENNLVRQGQPAWSAEDPSLQEVLKTLYRTALNTFKKKNMLINDAPETDLTINVITGRRTEAFASDLKVDKLAVQKFGVDELDKELEEIMKSYPYKYALVDNSIPELDLKKQGYFYILRFVHTRSPAARNLLGYDNNAQTAIASIVYGNDMVQVKTIPSDVPIFKFYTRQIEFNNVFLGTKWDADTTWQRALVNFISGLKKEMGVN